MSQAAHSFLSSAGRAGEPLWPVFEESYIPMTLIDRDRRFVALNDAAVALMTARGDRLVGAAAGTKVLGDDRSLGDKRWKQLLDTNEVYGEELVSDRDGKPLRVSFAGHGTTIDGRWLALFVALSARLEPGGAELIGTTAAAGRAKGSTLTPREREVVRRVALGANTRRIAADLFVSPATIRSHVRNAMVKTNAHTRAQLVAIAVGEGLIGA